MMIYRSPYLYYNVNERQVRYEGQNNHTSSQYYGRTADNGATRVVGESASS